VGAVDPSGFVVVDGRGQRSEVFVERQQLIHVEAVEQLLALNEYFASLTATVDHDET